MQSCSADGAIVDSQVFTAQISAHFQNCLSVHDEKIRQIDLDFYECQKAKSLQDCSEQQQVQGQSIWESRNLCLKKLPGASEACRENFDPSSLTHDTDKDGVPDFYEVYMRTDPCNPVSGGIPDGEGDFDQDQLRNKDDPNPICNESQPHLYYCHQI